MMFRFVVAIAMLMMAIKISLLAISDQEFTEELILAFLLALLYDTTCLRVELKKLLRAQTPQPSEQNMEKVASKKPIIGVFRSRNGVET